MVPEIRSWEGIHLSVKTLIANYGMGNLFSIRSALEYLGASVTVSSDRADVLDSSYLVLPGVGSFARAMHLIRELGLEEVIYEHAVVLQRPLLGICLGMQLLGISSPEEKLTCGLGLIHNHVQAFSNKAPKIPHIGFNGVVPPLESKLFVDLPSTTDFYFVHSYRMINEDPVANTASSTYGDDFVAAVEKDNIFGTQFHPELSQGNGLKVLRNFLRS